MSVGPGCQTAESTLAPLLLLAVLNEVNDTTPYLHAIVQVDG